ncbi:unnamed protein product [Boreogadus saida]
MSGRIRFGVTTVTGGGPLSSAQVAISHLQAGLVVPRCPQHWDRSWMRAHICSVAREGERLGEGRENTQHEPYLLRQSSARRTVEKDRGRNARAVRAAWVFDLASSRLSRAVMTST